MGLPYHHVPPNKTPAAEKGFGPVAGHLAVSVTPERIPDMVNSEWLKSA
jgi:hypothetical protein